MAYEHNGKQVTINNFDLDDVTGIFSFDANYYFISLPYGQNSRFKLINYGLTNTDLFFGTKYNTEFSSSIQNISSATKNTLVSLGGTTVGLTTSAINLGLNLAGWISTSLNSFTNIVVGINSSGESLVNYTGRWGGDGVDCFLYSQINFINHIIYNSQGGSTVGNNIGISSTNPQTLAISNRIQQEWAGEIPHTIFAERLQNKGTQYQVAVDEIFKDAVNYINSTSAVNIYSGNLWSLSWFLINGETVDNQVKPPYIDENTKDLVIQNKYNFRYTDDIAIKNYFVTQINNILGAGSTNSALNWWNTTPFSFTYPHLLLESAGRTIKTAKSQNIDPYNNLNGLEYNYFEVRISKKNLEIGNYNLYVVLNAKGWL